MHPRNGISSFEGVFAGVLGHVINLQSHTHTHAHSRTYKSTQQVNTPSKVVSTEHTAVCQALKHNACKCGNDALECTTSRVGNAMPDKQGRSDRKIERNAVIIVLCTMGNDHAIDGVSFVAGREG